MASLFDNAFGNFLDFDLEGIFDDVFGYGPAGNIINNLTGWDPGQYGSGPGTAEARRMVEQYQDLKQQPYTYNELDPSLGQASLIDQPGALEATGYDIDDLQYGQIPDADMLELLGYDAPEISGTQVGTASGYDPTTYDPTNPSSVSGVSDSAMRDNQLAALAGMEELYAQEGMTDTDRMLAEQILQGQATEASRGRDAQLQNIQERGLAGSGMESAAVALGNQQGAENARRSGIDIMRMAQNRKDNALSTSGQLAGQIRGTDINLSGRNADIINTFNRANANAQTAADLRNAQLQTDAQRYAAEQANLNQRINAEVQNQVEQINAQYARDAERYGADQANRAREANLSNAMRIAEQNVNIGNEASLRNFQSRNDQAEYLASRQNEASRINLNNQIDNASQNANIKNQFAQVNADIENQFKFQNQDNLNKIEQLGNEFQLDRLKGESTSSQVLIKQLNAEELKNEERRTANELADKGTPGGVGGGVSGSGSSGSPTGGTTGGAGGGTGGGTGGNPVSTNDPYRPNDTVDWGGADWNDEYYTGLPVDQGGSGERDDIGFRDGSYLNDLDYWNSDSYLNDEYSQPNLSFDFGNINYGSNDEYSLPSQNFDFNGGYFQDINDYGYDTGGYNDDYNYDVGGFAGGTYNTGTGYQDEYSQPSQDFDFNGGYFSDNGSGGGGNNSYSFEDTFNFWT